MIKYLFLLIAFYGCSTSKAQIENAEIMCAVNGGLVSVSSNKFLCQNGARFSE